MFRSIRNAPRIACAMSFVLALVMTRTAGAANALTLDVTVGTDLAPNACATTKAIAVVSGAQINTCYRVTNNTSTTLAFSTLRDDLGVILRNAPITLAPGASYQHNRISVASATRISSVDWSASADFPSYAMATTSADRIFGDAFDGATTPVNAFEDISATGTALGLGDDDAASVDIGFSFALWGVDAHRVEVGNNGWMLFDREGLIDYDERPIPDAAVGLALLPFWDDLGDASGDVFVETRGTAPNRRFIVQWNDRPHYDDTGTGDFPGTVTFEAILSEADNAIDFVYPDARFDNPDWDFGATATIGLNYDGAVANAYSFDTTRLAGDAAIHFAPSATPRFSAQDVVSVVVAAPAIVVTLPAIDVQTNVGAGNVVEHIDIDNVGDGTLFWSVGESPSAAHLPIVSRFVVPVGDPSKASFRAAPANPHAQTARTHAKHARLPFSGSVPAFAMHYGAFDRTDLVSLDATAPDAITVVASNLASQGLRRFFYGADFIDGDFSKLFAVDDAASELVSVDTGDGTQTIIGPLGIGIDHPTGLKQDPASGKLYMSVAPDDPSATECLLYTVDPNTGMATFVGPMTNAGHVIDIAIDANGQMFAVDIANDALIAIDKTTGAGSVIGSLGFDANFGEGLSFDLATGILYLAGYDNETHLTSLYTIDLDTGAATLVSPFDPSTHFDSLDALAIAHPSPCTNLADVPWLSVGPPTGITAAADTDQVDVVVHADSMLQGTYSALVCFASNDPARRRVAVPVSVLVSP